ncbi:hypothetical protein MHTCC0001_34550 [Flavobacteriaceae bacterium MHTCC 0001]
MEIKRKTLQGVINILSFNRHFYVIGISLVLLILVSKLLINWNLLIFVLAISTLAYGLIMPLLVSAFVYDFSGYYNFEWLDSINIQNSKSAQIVNINAGFDETSFILKHKLPDANLSVYDFYDPENHTEIAITRARKISLTYPNTKLIKTNHIPLENNSVDTIFLLSAAHEIRSYKEKILFLKECKRICKINGQVILVEHLRDMPNFLAFSIGFTHFFSKRVWTDAFKSAGFNSYTEHKFTPFMSIFKFN